MDVILWQEVPVKHFPWKKKEIALDIDLANDQIRLVLNSPYSPRKEYKLCFLREWLRWLSEEAKQEIPIDIWKTYETLRDDPNLEVESFWRLYQSSKITVKIKCGSTGIARGTTALSIWPAALFMCDWLVENEALFANLPGSRVGFWEIGCGLGIVGLSFASLNKNRYYGILSDANAEALKLVEENIQVNLLEENVKCICHSWGTSLPEQVNDCSILVASDIIYDVDLFASLCQTIDDFLNLHPQNFALLSLVVRNSDTWNSFMLHAKQKSIKIIEKCLPEEKCRFFSRFIDADSVKIIELCKS